MLLVNLGGDLKMYPSYITNTVHIAKVTHVYEIYAL